MRRSCVIGVAALVAAIVLSAAGWRVLASARAARPTVRLEQAVAPLARSLQRSLSTPHPLLRGVPIRPPALPAPQGVTCYAGPGRCSEVPCVEFAGNANPAVATSSAIVLRRSIAVPFNRGTVVPPAPSCQGHLGAPRTLRVSGP